jgi:DNA repair photolyase
MIVFVNIGETTCKNILNKSGIKGVDYAINPYIGCGHACRYCYARFMTRWYHQGEKWGCFVDVKSNAVERLRAEAPRKMLGVILLSSVTDPYQPAEGKYEVTRSILRVLREYDFPVQILTKSSLILRDLDVITELHEVEVGITLTCMNDSVRRVFEPGASTIIERLDALKKLSEVGVATYAFLGPLLPYLCEERLEELLNILADRVNRVLVDRLNIKAGNWEPIKNSLDRFYPKLKQNFQAASLENSKYYDSLRGKMRVLLNNRVIPFNILF